MNGQGIAVVELLMELKGTLLVEKDQLDYWQ